MAKYDSLRKLKRNRKLIALHLKHPELSQAEIGKKFGITGSRVSRILKAGK